MGEKDMRRGEREDHRGFTLLEIVLAIFLLGIALAPMIGAFSPVLESTRATEETAVFTNQARWTLSRVAALDFLTLSSHQGDPVDLSALFGSVSEADKENFTFNGQAFTPTVSISDASGGSGGLLRLAVTIDRVSLSTLKANL